MVDADWSIGTITATTIQINRIAAFPTGADRWGAIVVNPATGVIAFSSFLATTPLSATGLTTLTAYRIYVAWFISGTFARVSDWSPFRLVTTI